MKKRIIMLAITAVLGGGIIICCGGGDISTADDNSGSDGSAVQITPPSSDVPITVDDPLCLTFDTPLDATTVTLETFTAAEEGGSPDRGTFANDTPAALFPVPANTIPSIADMAFATPLLGKSTCVIDLLG